MPTEKPDAAAVAAQDDVIARFPIPHNEEWELVHASSLLDALQLLNSRNLSGVFTTGVTTLRKIVQNIFDHPLEEKFRCLKVRNPVVQRRLLGVPGGRAALLAIGFSVEQINGEPQYYLEASIRNRGKILAAHMQLTVIGLHPYWTTGALVDMQRSQNALMGGSTGREPLSTNRYRGRDPFTVALHRPPRVPLGESWGVLTVDPVSTTPSRLLEQAADVTGIPVARIHLLAREPGYADRRVNPCDFVSVATEYDLGPDSVILCSLQD